MRFPVLRSTMVPLAAGSLAGAVVIAGLTLGYYAWPLFALAAVLGLAAGVPLGLWTVRQMRAAPPIRRPASPSMDPEAARREVNPMARVSYPPARSQGQA
jgi:hypothetical protein